MTDRTRLPLPAPLTKDYGYADYTADQMRAYSDAENAALRAHLSNLLAVLHGDGGHYEAEHGTDHAVHDAIAKFYAHIKQADAEQFALRDRVKVLEDALQHIERVMGPKVPPCCDGCNFEWGEALKTVRAALQKT